MSLAVIRKPFLYGLALVAMTTLPGLASGEPVRDTFENRYQVWRAWVTAHPALSTYTTSQEFQAIVELGPSAIPFLVEKIEKNPEDFHLEVAIHRIAKKRFDKTEWPQEKLGDAKTAAAMYVEWWKEGRFKTGEQFAELHGKWKSLKAAKNDKDAEETYRRIVDLGIPALPYLIEEVDLQPEFALAISRLSDGALPPTATVADCRQWWDKNKQKVELPPRSESKQSSGKK